MLDVTDIEAGAQVGEGTKVWPFSTVRARAKIGKNCTIGRYVVIDNDVTIGNGCKIEDGAKIYGPAILEDSVFIGPNAVIANDRHPVAWWFTRPTKPTVLRLGTSVGANAVVMPGVEMGEASVAGAGTIVLRNVFAGDTIVGNPPRSLTR